MDFENEFDYADRDDAEGHGSAYGYPYDDTEEYLEMQNMYLDGMLETQIKEPFHKEVII